MRQKTKSDRFLHTHRFLSLSNSDNIFDNKDPGCDRLWKLERIVNLLNDAHSKYYAPSEYLAVGKVMLLLKGSVIFK
jgi:hypothetical protein